MSVWQKVSEGKGCSPGMIPGPPKLVFGEAPPPRTQLTHIKTLHYRRDHADVTGNATLSWHQCWEIVHSTSIPKGTAGHFSYTINRGMSKTEQSTLGASLGVDIKGIGAKLSAEFQESVTITEETKTVENSDIPVADFDRAWVRWQLTDHFCCKGSQEYGVVRSTAGIFIPIFGIAETIAGPDNKPWNDNSINRQDRFEVMMAP